MAMNLPLPPQQGIPSATYAYLFQMAQLLNLALAEVDKSAESASAEVKKEVSAAKTDTGNQFSTLKSLIVKTADVVYAEMDRISATLTGEYVAKSDFGTYVQELNAQLEANPDAVTQYYTFVADLQAADNTKLSAEDFANYRIETEGYIRTGIVAYDDGTPIIGVAVGQQLNSSSTDVVDGVEYPVVDATDFRAIFTAQELSFYQDNTKVAYISNKRLYIRDITVLSTITIGKYVVDSTDGLAFQWIGG